MNTQVAKRRDVYETLDAIDRGELSNQLQSALRKATVASINTMRKSKVTIEITIDPDTKTDPLAMRISGSVKTKLPENPVRASIFYPTNDGGLSRQHPQQRDIEDAGYAELPHPQTNKPAHDPQTGEILQEGGGSIVE